MKMNNQEALTYEATRARQSMERQPDKIHWDTLTAYRDSPYRQLHHQRGLIGTFRIRLLEAADLKRNYWSALALGPVKHLGLSKAHGAVSSFCSFALDFEDPRHHLHMQQQLRMGPSKEDLERKPAAKPSGKNSQSNVNQKQSNNNHQHLPTAQSHVIPSDNNPVWENCQFDFPLNKGVMPDDGMRIILRVRADEDGTAVENMIPGLPSGGDSRMLGVGTLDLTDLCLGETATGQSLPGIRDAWIPLSLAGRDMPQEFEEFVYQKGDDPLAPPNQKKKEGLEPPTITGRVRVLVSYHPYGLEPQPKDVVALESFARRSPERSNCRPILPPLMPMTVLERRGAYLLVEYYLPLENSIVGTGGPGAGFIPGGGRGGYMKACIRVHRNAVFVIERRNFADAAQNLALLPVDAVMSTPLGQASVHALGPLVAAGKEVLMPALLSLKLVWLAARTTTLAGLSGVSALGSTLWQEGTSSLTASHYSNDHNMHGGGGNHHSNFYHGDPRNRHRPRNVVTDSSASSQFVSL